MSLRKKRLFIRMLFLKDKEEESRLYNVYHFSDESHVENKNESFIRVETSSTCSSNSNSMDCESQISEMLMTSHSTIDDTTNDVNVSNGNRNNECNSNVHSITNDVNDHDYLNDSNVNNVNEELDECFRRLYNEFKKDYGMSIKHKIYKQITEQRLISHNKYLRYKSNNANDMNESITKDNIANPINKHANMHTWKNGTCVIVGDSIILGLNEKRMGDRFKVQGFSGAKIHDMYHYLHHLLEKNPTFMILMVGTNDATHKNAVQIIAEILKLKEHIEAMLPSCSVIISCPTMRRDRANPQAHKVVFNLRKKLNSEWKY